MGSTTTHGAPYPVGTDRVVDGDNAIQALAEWADSQLYGGAATGPGVWSVAAGVVVCTVASATAAPGTTVQEARVMKIGRTVFFAGWASTTTTVATAAILLPPAAGVPFTRSVNAGSLVIMGAGSPTDQMTIGVMTTDKTKVTAVARDATVPGLPASCTIRWNLIYETTA